MLAGSLAVVGGLGLFLLGMTLLTDGLRSLSADLLRHFLTRFTRSPWTGALTGFFSTICVQSSSVITVMAVGFVGAGLLSFSESLGIIFGANVGSTATGWFIVLFGLRFNLTPFFLPFVFIGALLRILAQGVFRELGNAVAGFSLVFLGIAQLQSGMELYSPSFHAELLPGGTWMGHAILVVFGMLTVIVMQSSGASLAATLTALHVGNISLLQACYLVIGMNVGTTATAALASLAGNFNARRTAMAHVLFNVFTGSLAFLCVPLFLRLSELFAPTYGDSYSTLHLVLFHTSFNLTGALIALPFTANFAGLVTRMYPPSQRDLARRLEPSLIKHPEVAMDAIFATLSEVTELLFTALRQRLQGANPRASGQSDLDDLISAIRDTMHYLLEMRTHDAVLDIVNQRSNAMHVMDHLTRLAERCREIERTESIQRTPDLDLYRERIIQITRIPVTKPAAEITGEPSTLYEALYRSLDASLEEFRQATIEHLASGQLTSEETLHRLDGYRWLRRVSFHAWRITAHLYYRHNDSSRFVERE